MRRLTLFSLFVIALIRVSYSQEREITITIKDELTKEIIPYCTLYVIDKNEQKKVLISNSYGIIVVSDIKDKKLCITHISYETKILDINSSDFLEVYLKRKEVNIDEVIIYSPYRSTNKGNSYTYTPLHAASSISIVGEPDVLRHISNLPGVSQGIEGSLGLFIRGSNGGSNGIYFNEVPIYSSSHLMGLFSSFPADIIKQTTFSSGGLPSSVGNLSSSMLDIITKQEYGSKFNGKLTISPYITGVYTSIPLIKNKMSVQLSGRTSFVPFFVNSFSKQDEKMNVQIFDVTSIINYSISDQNKLEAMFFASNDYFSYQTKTRESTQNWGTTVAKIGWNYDISDKLKLRSNGYFSDTYSTQRENNYNEYNSTLKTMFTLGSSLKELAVKSKLDYAISNELSINTGISFQQQKFIPTNEKFNGLDSDVTNKDEQNTHLFSAFAEVNYEKKNLFDLKLGYRHTVQASSKNTENNFDAHFLGHVYLKNNLGIEIAFDRMTQYYHVLEGLPTGWSLNIMIPSSNNQKPELTHQYYTGLFWKNKRENQSWNLTLGGYYRDMKNLVSYINALNVFGLNTSNWEDEIDVGDGKSYGLEMSANFNTPILGATLSYTLSKSDRMFPAINGGKEFPFKFDRKHILNHQAKVTVAKYKNRKGSTTEHLLNSVLAYTSGNRMTIPLGSYQGEAPPYWDQMSGMIFPPDFYNNVYDRQLMSGKNEFIARDYVRLDFAYTFINRGPKVNHELSLSVFNVLNRHNPYTYFNEEGRWKQLSIMPIMPSIRWTMSW